MVNVSNVIAMLLVVDLSTSDEKPLNCEEWKYTLNADPEQIQCKKYGEPGRSINCAMIMK